MRRCICEATTASARLALRSANTSLFTTVGGPTRALTARHPIKLTSPRCHSAWQPNRGRRSTYRRGKTVQTTETTSLILANSAPVLKVVQQETRVIPIVFVQVADPIAGGFVAS